MDLQTEEDWFAILAEVAPGVPQGPQTLQTFLATHTGRPSPRIELARVLLQLELQGDPRAFDAWKLAALPHDEAASPATARAMHRLTAPPARPWHDLGQWLDAPWWHGELLAGGAVGTALTPGYPVGAGGSLGWIEGVRVARGVLAAELELGLVTGGVTGTSPVVAGRVQYGSGPLWFGAGYASTGAVQELVRVVAPRYSGAGWQLEGRVVLEEPWDAPIGLQAGVRLGFAWGAH